MQYSDYCTIRKAWTSERSVIKQSVARQCSANGTDYWPFKITELYAEVSSSRQVELSYSAISTLSEDNLGIN